MTLSESRLVSEAGERVFERGVDYTRYVHGMRVTGASASGTIQAQNVYTVELDWSRDEIDGRCTCPHFAGGHFCKHLVALGLCAIDERRPRVATDGDLDLVEMVQQLEIEELRTMVVDLAQREGSVLREIELRHAAARGDMDRLSRDLVAFVRETMSIRGFIDYRRSFDVAADFESMLDELERYLDAHAADAVRPALLRAITRLRTLVGRADDSAGVLGDACQRAADLYARSCREGNPDGVKIAKWLVRFRRDSPGWPELGLADFVDAFDDRALAAYRKAVDRLDSELSEADRSERFTVERMLLELADRDGDVDRAIELLSAGDHVRYAAIVARLAAADRHDEAVMWIDRAVDSGRVSDRFGAGNDYFLDPGAVARTYRGLDRLEDALGVLLDAFTRSPGHATFRRLIDLAAEVGREEQTRSRALTAMREQAAAPFGSGATLVEIALGENDLDAAWEAAEEFGAGHSWQRLAEASAQSRPIDAAELYRLAIEEDLERPANTKLYPGIARRLVRMRELYVHAAEVERFGRHLRSIREGYGRRPALMRALDAAGL